MQKSLKTQKKIFHTSSMLSTLLGTEDLEMKDMIPFLTKLTAQQGREQEVSPTQ